MPTKLGCQSRHSLPEITDGRSGIKTGHFSSRAPPAALAEQESQGGFHHRQLDDQKAAIWLTNIIRPLWAHLRHKLPEQNPSNSLEMQFD
jgi:hypothetical protein